MTRGNFTSHLPPEKRSYPGRARGKRLLPMRGFPPTTAPSDGSRCSRTLFPRKPGAGLSVAPWSFIAPAACCTSSARASQSGVGSSRMAANGSPSGRPPCTKDHRRISSAMWIPAASLRDGRTSRGIGSRNGRTSANLFSQWTVTLHIIPNATSLATILGGPARSTYSTGGHTSRCGASSTGRGGFLGVFIHLGVKTFDERIG